MFESKAAVTVNNFTGSKENPAKADKNGKMPIILTVLAGKLPNKAIVLSGTVAERAGLTVGRPALIQCRETESSEQYGRQFNIGKISDMTGLEVITAESFLGKPEVFDVASVEEPAQA